MLQNSGSDLDFPWRTHGLLDISIGLGIIDEPLALRVEAKWTAGFWRLHAPNDKTKIASVNSVVNSVATPPLPNKNLLPLMISLLNDK